MTSPRLATLSYFKTGGTCHALHAPTSLVELQEIVRSLPHSGIPYFILGSGTNSLLSDEHWHGAVLSLQCMNAISDTDDTVVCQAGVENVAFVEHCYARALTGAEWMTALPGQIGATVRMNARCYGGEISSLVSSVTAVSATGEVCVYRQPQQIFHGYKDTRFMHSGELVVAVEMQLASGEREKIAARMTAVKDDRTHKGQFLHPSCGCVFKNDYEVGVPSGVLLEQAGVQEFSQKNVFVSPRHANFIFNIGASSAEIVALSLKMRDAVYRRFAVWLQYEMEFLGHFPPTLMQKVQQRKPHDLHNKELQRLKHSLGS